MHALEQVEIHDQGRDYDIKGKHKGQSGVNRPKANADHQGFGIYSDKGAAATIHLFQAQRSNAQQNPAAIDEDKLFEEIKGDRTQSERRLALHQS